MTVVSARSGRARDWSGAAVVVVTASVLVQAFASKVIDGRHQVVDYSGAVSYVQDGNVAGLVNVALFGVAAVLAVIGIVASCRVRLRGWPAWALLLVVLWWVLCSLVLRRDPADLDEAPFTAVAGIIVIALIARPPTLRSLHALNWVRDITVAVMLLVSTIDPASRIACRPDKCGVFGGLWTGFYFTENAAAQVVIVLIPAAITIRSRARLAVSLLLAGAFVLATGSRTSLAGLALLVAFVLFYRGMLLGERSRVGIGWWPLVPLVSLAASTVVFLSFSSTELTDRGYIYAAIRSQLTGSALIIGSGPSTMATIFALNLDGRFEPFGEHGEASHLLVETGLVGFLLFASAMVALLLASRPWPAERIAAIGLVVAASLLFVTEPGWALDAHSATFWPVLLACGLFGAPPRTPATAPG